MLRRVVLLLSILFFISGCVISSGVVHRVGRGETLWRISKTYGVEIDKIVEINDIKDPSDIRVGSKIFIPGVKRVRKVTPAKAASKKTAGRRKSGIKRGVRIFAWPVKGKISSRFGARNGERHDGLDIRVPRGTVIRAADVGKVVFVSSNYHKYGRIIILEHDNNYFTVYAHNSKNNVKVGQRVRKGERIGRVGKSGNATGYHLHFEVRKGKAVLNPLFFLP